MAGRRLRRVLLAVAAAGVVATLAILAWLAGGRSAGTGAPIVLPVSPSERREKLDEAAEGTRGVRDAARKELERIEPGR